MSSFNGGSVLQDWAVFALVHIDMTDIVASSANCSDTGNLGCSGGIHQRASRTRNKTAIMKLEINTNGMKDALLKVTGQSEYAKGLLAGGTVCNPSVTS
jgi:hypothetical protein